MTKIAIIGTSALFPGASTPKKFWKNLMSEKDLTSHASEQDFGMPPESIFHKDKGIVDRCYSIRGGYIRDFNFDPNGYELPADYVSKQDKLFQWSLYTAKEALIDGGYHQKMEDLKNCGLILGNLSFPTSSSHQLIADLYARTLESNIQELLNTPELKIKDHQQRPAENEVLDYTPSEMVSKALALGKTHYALDAACATSLYAIKLACDELITGKADMMLAGAVSASDQLFIHMGFSIFHAYTPMDQKFVPFDKESAGLVSSEGAGMVLLKRLEDAERDGDQILGVIGGIGLSNDGRGKFLLSPNPKGQNLAFERAYANKDIVANDTSYIECHATGTPLGDTTELNSIATYFSKYGEGPLLGSVKSNMGHLLTAAGMTGLLKVLMAMHHEVIPPNINLTNPISSDVDWKGDDKMIVKHTPWKDEHKQAGINSFGFGGTNAHMVVQNYLGKTSRQPSQLIKLQSMAVVGMDAHFGNCKSLDAFYHTIYNGQQEFTELPKNRWKGIEANASLLKKYGFENGKAPKGAYIEDFEIDLLRYKIQPKEAELLHPQQALLLKVADNAIKDAGLEEHQNVAVLVAMETELAIHQCLSRWDVEWQVKEALANINLELEENDLAELIQVTKTAIYHREGKTAPSEFTSFIGNLMASRISALWDFSGAAFTVSCGENSVFKALEIAQNMLSIGEVDAVVVGAVDFSGGVENVLLRQKRDGINTNNLPSSFSVGNKGWMIGEGAGAIVLQKNIDLENKKVYTVIDKVGEVNVAKHFDYIELAATGITSQDRFEQDKLLQHNSDKATALGTVKSNIGNTFAASGMASLIKTSLCMYHRFIPALPNWTRPENDDFQETVYYFPAQSRPWLLATGVEKRNAAVNGVGDIQVQLSSSDAIKNDSHSFLQSQTPELFILTGNDSAKLLEELELLKSNLNTDQDLHSIAELLYAKFGQEKSRYSIVLIANNEIALLKEIQFFQNQLAKAFQNNLALKTPSGSYFTPSPLGHEGKVAFVYPGSATAYEGLGKDTLQLFPELLTRYENQVGDVDRFINEDYLYPKLKSTDEASPNIYENSIAMMSAGVFYSAIFTEILRDQFKLEPDMAFGYSMGECSSMWYSLGVWHPNGANKFRQSPIFKNRFAGDLELLAEHWGVSTEVAKEKWVSIVLLAPRQKVEAIIEGKEKVFLTFINTEEEVIISGNKDVCAQIAADLNCHSITIPFQNVIHHSFCIKEEAGLLDMHNFDITDQPAIDFYSSITQSRINTNSQEIAENSVAVCAQQVNFPKTIQTVYDAGARIFIEVGANATCTGWIQSNLKGKEHLAVAMDQKGKSDVSNLVNLLAQLTSHGVALDLSLLFPKVEESTKKRQFMKKITPGGTPMGQVFQDEEVVARFSKVRNLEKKKVVANRELVLAGHDMPAYHTESASTTLEANENKTITTNFNKVENRRSFMDTSTLKNEVSKAVSHSNQLGENGLRLQNFEAGEQFEGKEVVFSQEDLEEFATGKIANVFGPEYAIIDTFRRRVMLPMYPYLLVSRVTKMNAQLGVYEPSTMTTEYDIPYDAWYTTDGQIPSAVCVESGQCDLLLISYLGIDLQNKGNLVYRLLDCTLTFMDDLPYEGQTLRYDISINSFVSNGDNLLFFFSYLCYVEDRLVLKMDGGCAGFFADDQLVDGAGVVYNKSEIEARQNAEKQHFTPLLETKKTSFSKQDLQHLIDGDIEKCFDDISYYANGRNPSLRIPPEKILMLDRITSVDLHGGAYGLGYIVAEKDLKPDDWYFPCHFRDDEVLAGSLQAEGGGNLLRFFMMMLGLQRLTKDARFQPIFGVGQKVRCRKQVTPTADTKLIYKLEIKEIGLFPNPYVIGDLEIISDGIITVHFENLGLQLQEKSSPQYLNESEGVKISPRSEGALLNEKDITTFALGNMTDCFGPDFAVYNGRKMSRQPNTDLQVISRILSVDGVRGDFSKDVTILAEYDVPEDAWYYQQNSNVTMPYSVLMEVALQPCGLLGAYMGSTLQFPDKELFFRNLDGDGESFDLPQGTDFRGKTISNKSVLVSSIAHGGTILQRYTFELSLDGQVFYKGSSSFGFFAKEALAAQAGLDKGAEVPAWYVSEQLQRSDYMQINLDSLYGRMKLFKAPENKPHYRLAEDQLNMLHELIIAKDKGKFGNGYIHATKFIKTYDWFFTCHFYLDPVMPGSLGVESILQSMQVYALQQDLGKDFKSPKFVQVANHKTKWKYRGQILPPVEEMHLEVHIKNIENIGEQLVIVAEAYLWNDKMRIYHVTDIALGIEEGATMP